MHIIVQNYTNFGIWTNKRKKKSYISFFCNLIIAIAHGVKMSNISAEVSKIFLIVYRVLV